MNRRKNNSRVKRGRPRRWHWLVLAQIFPGVTLLVTFSHGLNTDQTRKAPLLLIRDSFVFNLWLKVCARVEDI
jgi:hypothetical protein